jgi:hypothetical protein
MPRLIPQRAKQDEEFVVATETVYLNNSSNGLKPWFWKGEVLPSSDPRVKAHPEAFEDAPETKPGETPRANEAAAVATVTYMSAGGWIFHGRRFYPWDPIVRATPQFFATVIPRD